MQTHFTAAQLADPANAASERILRACVHCGFCTATCPTYQVLGDELDSPRGRIVLLKDMLENQRTPSAAVVTHIDRCLSCLACMTTCPSGVNYMHLVDHGRAYIERHYRRPWPDRVLRRLLGWLLPRPMVFRAALVTARPLRALGAGWPGRLGAMFRLAPSQVPAPSAVDRPQIFPAEGIRQRRVALLTGCAQQVVAPQINEATIRLLTRLGCEVVVASGVGCCGALQHHLGQEAAALSRARAAIDGWLEAGPLDAIVINTSGCGTVVKDYGFLLRTDPAYAEKAAAIAALAKDVTEVLADLLPIRTAAGDGIRVAYHAACSLQHGQRVTAEPRQLLRDAGFTVAEVPEGHLCCGSAGTYNLLQPEIALTLRDRKLANIRETQPDVIATGNVGCMTQLATGTAIPVVHTVELLDWATGGPMPQQLKLAG